MSRNVKAYQDKSDLYLTRARLAKYSLSHAPPRTHPGIYRLISRYVEMARKMNHASIRIRKEQA
jgi:hypothetical protein